MPETVLERIRSKAKSLNRKICLTESDDVRNLQAAAKLAQTGYAQPVLVGDADAVARLARENKVSLAGVEIVPHTWGHGLGLLVHLHLAASLPNCGYVEFPHDPPSGLTAAARDQMLAQTLTIDADGCLRPPDAPGFGFVLDDERIDRCTLQVMERGDCAFAG